MIINPILIIYTISDKLINLYIDNRSVIFFLDLRVSSYFHELKSCGSLQFSGLVP